jgi:hypothetical protein
MAREDFPEPEGPVITIILFLGRYKSIDFRLCSEAPFTMIYSLGEILRSQ